MNKLNKAFYLKLVLTSILVILSSCRKAENLPQTTPADFFSYLRNGEVNKIEIIINREACVYLTAEDSPTNYVSQNPKAAFKS